MEMARHLASLNLKIEETFTRQIAPSSFNGGHPNSLVGFYLCARLKKTKYIMGLKFGELIKMRGIISFKISAHEQNALAGVISQGVPNMLRRIKGQIFYVAPPFLFTYTLISWAKKDHDRRQRKDPSKYENEK